MFPKTEFLSVKLNDNGTGKVKFDRNDYISTSAHYKSWLKT
jgi:hypothetical protein